LAAAGLPWAFVELRDIERVQTMALVIKHSTLTSRLYEILITPFVFIGFGLFTRWWVFALLAVICVTLWATGAMQFAVPKIAEFKEELIIGSLCICFLWIVATMLSIFDYFRFRGWTHAPGPQPLTSRAEEFLAKLVGDQSEDASRILDTQLRDKYRGYLRDWRHELGAATTVVNADQLSTVDEMIFRATLAKMKDMSLAKNDVFLAIPVIETLDIPVGGPMKIALFLMRPEICDDIQDFRVLEIARPRILA
jgi:hypothetical protein